MQQNRDQYEVLFRKLESPLPGHLTPGTHWYVECYETGLGLGNPVGMAFVTSVEQPNSGKSGAGQVEFSFAYIDYLFVLDEHRRKGIGILLLDACIGRWPHIHYDGVTRAGKAMLRAWRKERKGRSIQTGLARGSGIMGESEYRPEEGAA
jgi:GNAT superfamily N-acetyltransferase